MLMLKSIEDHNADWIGVSTGGQRSGEILQNFWS